MDSSAWLAKCAMHLRNMPAILNHYKQNLSPSMFLQQFYRPRQHIVRIALACSIAALQGCTSAGLQTDTPPAVASQNIASETVGHSNLAEPVKPVAVLAEPEPAALQVALVPDPEPIIITDLWQHLRRDMHWSLHTEQPRVQQEIRWLQRHPNYLLRLRERLQNYLPYVYREVQLRDMPAELALLPIVESAFDVYAFSHGGAAGPWQFIRGTARQYGLQLNDWYDGRRDIVASTDAALNYLQDLHGRFDDWHLALAGYNAGAGNVRKALRKKPGGNYFELPLPRETRHYVPRLLAFVAVVQDPDQYGLELPELDIEPRFHVLETEGQFQLDKLAAAADLSMETFRFWNPALSRWATSPDGPHHVILPASVDLASTQQTVAAINPAQRMDWQEITVRSGDTLSELAARYHADVATLRQANRLRNNHIRAGKTLLIPLAGQATAPLQTSGTATHKVAAGDSLWKIAREYNISLNSLMKANHVGPKDPLPVGKTLVLPGHGLSGQIDGQTNAERVVRTVRYKVRAGDSLSRIAGRFNVTVAQIVRWNRLDSKRYLQPGQGLLLHVNVVGGN